MTDLLAARSQMALSLAFHILFAAVGIAMPLLMVLAEARWLRTGQAVYLELAKRWARGTAVLFAVGAVSGTVLSFELGLLWPRFMEFAGSVIGMPFSLEGFAFFLEAIFLGIYLYGWKRVPPRAHLFAGVMVFVSGALSGIFVVTANAWMNTPAGFTAADGRVVSVDVFAAMANPAAFSQCLHMTIAALQAVGFAVAGIHAFMLLREPANLFHEKAYRLALSVGAAAALLQLVSGDISAKQVARNQPVKLAAMEGQWETERGAPLRIGGFPDESAETTRWALEVPKGLSWLARLDPDAEIMGLKAVPRGDRPPVAVVHWAFQVMVACGLAMAGVALWGIWLFRRTRRFPQSRAYLRAVAACAPLGFVAVEAGWVVTEVGRQPWIIQGVMRTAEAVTPMKGLTYTFALFTGLYVLLAAVVLVLLRRDVVSSPKAP